MKNLDLPLGAGLGPERVRRISYLRERARLVVDEPSGHRPNTSSSRNVPQSALRDRPARGTFGSSIASDSLAVSEPPLSTFEIQCYEALVSTWIYLKTVPKVLAAIFVIHWVLYCGGAILIGNGHKLPGAFIGMSQAVVQILRCGWDVPVERDGWGCLK